MKKSRVKKSAIASSAAVFALLSTVSFNDDGIKGVSAIKIQSKLEQKMSTNLQAWLSSESKSESKLEVSSSSKNKAQTESKLQ